MSIFPPYSFMSLGFSEGSTFIPTKDKDTRLLLFHLSLLYPSFFTSFDPLERKKEYSERITKWSPRKMRKKVKEKNGWKEHWGDEKKMKKTSITFSVKHPKENILHLLCQIFSHLHIFCFIFLYKERKWLWSWRTDCDFDDDEKMEGSSAVAWNDACICITCGLKEKETSLSFSCGFSIKYSSSNNNNIYTKKGW